MLLRLGVGWFKGHVLGLDYEPGKSLKEKYSIPEENIGSTSLTKLGRDTTLSIIWTVAGEHVKRAQELVGQ